MDFDQLLENSFEDTENVFTSHVDDPDKYIADAIKSVRSNKCEPFLVQAPVMDPGFEGKELGDMIEGYCLAHSEGYWLVYQTEEKVFYCFWGLRRDSLGAHGVIGSALECWLQ